MPEIVIVRAVNLPVDLVATGPVNRPEAPERVARKPGSHSDHLREISPVQWDILNRFAGEHGCLRRSGRVERQAGGVHFDGSRLSCYGELYWEAIDRSRGNLNLLYLERFETGGRCGNCVNTQRKVREVKLPRARGHRRFRDTRGVICNLHLCARNGCAGLVRYGPVDASAEVLCSGERRAQKHHQQ